MQRTEKRTFEGDGIKDVLSHLVSVQIKHKKQRVRQQNTFFSQ